MIEILVEETVPISGTADISLILCILVSILFLTFSIKPSIRSASIGISEYVSEARAALPRPISNASLKRGRGERKKQELVSPNVFVAN